MVLIKSLFGAAALFISAVSAVPTERSSKWTTFSNVTIFTPTANYTTPQVLYARTVQIGDTLLATWENYSPEPPKVYFPIYASKDGGKTWTERSRVQDTQNGWGLRYQPVLYVLPRRIGAYPAGTLLISGSSIPTDLSQIRLEVYASLDNGHTWSFVSHVASGGAAQPVNGVPAIWEPFLLVNNDKLILYYSDQRNPKFGQNLIHTTTRDLKTWSPDVPDVEYDVYTARPGMTTVAKLPNGKFIMTYEYGGGPNADGSTDYRFPVYYKIASDPTQFNASTGLPIISYSAITSAGKGNTTITPEPFYQPTGSPYIVWTPYGGPNGTLVANGHSSGDLFLNRHLGAVDRWVRFRTGAPNAYTRSLRVLEGEREARKILIVGAGQLPPAENWQVRADVVELP